MIHLACLPDGGVALRSEIAEAQYIPTSFMAKILRSLVRARLLRSSRGVNGGFALARPAAEINMLEIVEAIEGPLALTDCVPDPSGCGWSVDCPASTVWAKVQNKVQGTLKATTLEDLVSTPRRNGRVSQASKTKAARLAAAQARFRQK
jgi:Rrf2 family protein